MAGRVVILDYDAGNLHSVRKAAEVAGLSPVVSAYPEELEDAAGVILPGVGAFGDCMARLHERGLDQAIMEWVVSDRPLLGICIGLQVLFDWGEEGDGAPGLGILPGRVRRIAVPEGKVPHMGWNSLRLLRPSPLFAGITEGAYVYFVHSFQAEVADSTDLTAVTDYGGAVTAAVERGRLYAVQFHPEKSSSVGLRLLRNFGRICGIG